MTRHALLWGWFLLLATAVPAAAEDPPAPAAGSAVLHGVVRDQNGEPLVGATVVATSPVLHGTQAVISDEAGAWAIENLPPGTYEVTVYYSEVTLNRTGVIAVAGKRTQVMLKIDTRAAGGEVITISDRGATIDSDYTQRIPTGRTFGAVLGAAAGSAGDAYGVSFSGSTSLESGYVVDGVSTGGQQGPAAGLLTAATVPDSDRFDAYRDFLGRYPDERQRTGLVMDRRLRVRVVDVAGRPVNDAAVSVVAGNQVRIQGRTHADGIWDLFPAIDAPGAAEVVRVEASAGMTTAWTPARLPGRGSAEVELRLAMSAAPPRALDLAFAIDVTGSMGDEMSYLQRELQDIVARIRAAVPGVSIRMAGVAYRDRGDTVPLARRDFDEDVGGFIAWLGTLRADGGGDYPEDVEAALAEAVPKLSWRSGDAARILVLLGDAPPQFYADAGYRVRDALRDARTAGLRILPVAASGADRTVEYLFRALGAYTSTPYVYLTDHSGIGEDHLEADTDRIDVERFNDLLVRLVVADLRGEGMHAPGNWQAWNDYRSPPWAGRPRRLVAGLGTGFALLGSYTEVVPMHWARAGLALGDLELRVHLGWSSELDGQPRRLARTRSGEPLPPGPPATLGLVPGAGARYLFGPWRRLRAFAGAALEAQILRAHAGAGIATLFSSQAGFELRSPSTGGLAAGLQVGGHVMLHGHRDLTTPRPHLDLTLYAEHRF